MKTEITYTRLIVLAGLLALTNGDVSGQSAATASTGSDISAETPQNNFERQGAEFDRQAAAFAKQAAEMDKRMAQLSQARAAEAGEASPGISRTGGGGFGGFGGGGGVSVDQNGIVNFFGGGRTGGGTMIIPKEATPAKVLSETEEDLNVMARILEKAIGHDENRAMGIVIRDSILGGSSNLRNLYIEGYGALFFLNVNFPLLAPPTERAEPTQAQETNSEWEETKRELYSPPGTPSAFQERMRVVVTGADSSEPYDAGKVQELKSDLTAALKNASHIRSLNPDEMITVVVNGRSASPKPSVPKETTGSRRVNPSTVSDRNTRMVIRARKSDVDAFQKGDLDAQGFEKKVSVTVY